MTTATVVKRILANRQVRLPVCQLPLCLATGVTPRHMTSDADPPDKSPVVATRTAIRRQIAAHCMGNFTTVWRGNHRTWPDMHVKKTAAAVAGVRGPQRQEEQERGGVLQPAQDVHGGGVKRQSRRSVECSTKRRSAGSCRSRRLGGCQQPGVSLCDCGIACECHGSCGCAVALCGRCGVRCSVLVLQQAVSARSSLSFQAPDLHSRG